MPTKLSPKFSIEKARKLQQQLSRQVIRDDQLPTTIDYVAGVDVAYGQEVSIAAVAVLDFDSFSLVESQVACHKTQFPYIPTLLSFRELPPTLSAMHKLVVQPDVFLVDGQGIAHPYRLGFAAHLGLAANAPTIGVAKSLLCGQVEPFENRSWAPVTSEGETIGAALITRLGRKPIYVSIGHRVSLERALNIVMECSRVHRIPEPIRRAHRVAGEEIKKLEST